MKGKFLITVAAISGLAACNGGGAVNPGAPTASSGYAKFDSHLDADGVTLTSRQMMHFEDEEAYGLREATVKVRNTADPTVKYVTVKGTEVRVDQLDDGSFLGNKGDLWVSIAPFSVSDNEQVVLAWLIWDDDRHLPDWDHIWGAFTPGYNTDPVDIDGRTLDATYIGDAVIGLQRDDANWAWASAFGVATLNADFDLDTIDGSIVFDFVATTDPSGVGYEITVPTTATINAGFIDGNIFESTLTLDDPADFHIDSADDLDLTGMFYGDGGTAVGGTFSGNGSDDGGATSVFIQGGFIGSEQP